MANLTIANAYIGYDTDNIKKALDNINREVIIGAVTKMTNGLGELQDKIDASWRGASADMFKKNMFSDMSNIQQGLRDCYKILESEIVEIINALAKLDETLIEGRPE